MVVMVVVAVVVVAVVVVSVHLWWVRGMPLCELQGLQVGGTRAAHTRYGTSEVQLSGPSI
jgi:hypothetical protein